MYDEDIKLELVAFILNKNNVCKNKNCVIGNGTGAKYGVEHNSKKPNGIWAGINSDSNSYCITITIDTKELPFYCQKVSIFAYNVNKLCSNTIKWMNIFINGNKVFKLKSLRYFDSFHIGDIIKCSDINNEYAVVKKCNMSYCDLIYLGKIFEINFIPISEPPQKYIKSGVFEKKATKYIKSGVFEKKATKYNNYEINKEFYENVIKNGSQKG